MGLPSSGCLMALAGFSAGTRKIEDGGAVVFRSTVVLCEPGALKIGNWPNGGLAALKIGETGNDCGLGPHSDDFLHGGSYDSSLFRRVAI